MSKNKLYPVEPELDWSKKEEWETLMDDDVSKVVKFLEPLELSNSKELATVLVENGMVNPVLTVARLKSQLAPVIRNIWLDVVGNEDYHGLVKLYQEAK